MPARSRVAEARIGRPVASVHAEPDPGSGATRLSVFAPDAPGLFYRIAAGLAAGGRVGGRRPHPHHARRHGARQSARHRRARAGLCRSAPPRAAGRGGDARAWTSDEPQPPAALPLSSREEAFAVAPSVLIAEQASTRTTVVEVNARDRPGLLARLAYAIHAHGPCAPFGAYRDLWRARGRRLLRHQQRRAGSSTAPRSPTCAPRLFAAVTA